MFLSLGDLLQAYFVNLLIGFNDLVFQSSFMRLVRTFIRKIVSVKLYACDQSFKSSRWAEFCSDTIYIWIWNAWTLKIFKINWYWHILRFFSNNCNRDSIIITSENLLQVNRNIWRYIFYCKLLNSEYMSYTILNVSVAKWNWSEAV